MLQKDNLGRRKVKTKIFLTICEFQGLARKDKDVCTYLGPHQCCLSPNL